MRCLITGAGGFAGSHLAEYLARQGEEVTAFIHPQDALHNLSGLDVRIERGDLRDADRVLDVFRTVKPQRIYHLAALSSPEESFRDPRSTYDVNFTGTFNFLLAWRQLQIDSRFLYVSSSAVYGWTSGNDLPLREDAALRPANPYAGSKAAAEMLAIQFFQGYGLPIIRVRPFNHTGPRQDPQFVCSGLARQVAEIDLQMRPPVATAGNLEARRDFSDVRDIVRGYHMLLEGGAPGEVYQLCSGYHCSIRTILENLIALSSRPVSVKSDESLMRSRDSLIVYGDYSKARKEVGWEPQYKLETTLADLKAYWEHALRPLARHCSDS
ncbi:MAG: GDP-mannose 4,6-dehydratase [Terriglobia bacterium]